MSRPQRPLKYEIICFRCCLNRYECDKHIVLLSCYSFISSSHTGWHWIHTRYIFVLINTQFNSDAVTWISTNVAIAYAAVWENGKFEYAYSFCLSISPFWQKFDFLRFGNWLSIDLQCSVETCMKLNSFDMLVWSVYPVPLTYNMPEFPCIFFFFSCLI
jgi:hypothetical protein